MDVSPDAKGAQYQPETSQRDSSFFLFGASLSITASIQHSLLLSPPICSSLSHLSLFLSHQLCHLSLYFFFVPTCSFNHVDIKRNIWSHTNTSAHTCAAHTCAAHAGVPRAVVANDKGVCIPAPLLLQRLETLTQINRQHGPVITISVSPLLPASLHSRLTAPPSHICLDLTASIYLPLFLSLSLCPPSHILHSSSPTSSLLIPFLFPPAPLICTSFCLLFFL